METTLKSGNTTRTLKVEKTESGWELKVTESWKGQEPSEVWLSGQSTRNSETEANRDLEKAVKEMTETGWSL